MGNLYHAQQEKLGKSGKKSYIKVIHTSCCRRCERRKMDGIRSSKRDISSIIEEHDSTDILLGSTVDLPVFVTKI